MAQSIPDWCLCVLFLVFSLFFFPCFSGVLFWQMCACVEVTKNAKKKEVAKVGADDDEFNNDVWVHTRTCKSSGGSAGLTYTCLQVIMLNHLVGVFGLLTRDVGLSHSLFGLQSTHEPAVLL